jgi:hypothetical protein
MFELAPLILSLAVGEIVTVFVVSLIIIYCSPATGVAGSVNVRLLAHALMYLPAWSAAVNCVDDDRLTKAPEYALKSLGTVTLPSESPEM